MSAEDLLERMGPVIPSIDDPLVEQLVPALRKCLWEDQHGNLWIKHPWVNTFLPFVNQSNDIWRTKFGMMRRYLSERNLSAYLSVVVERPWRYSTLQNWWLRGSIDHGELRDVLPGVWMDTEMPTENLLDPAFLFDAAGFLTDDEEVWGALPDPLTIYRGGRSDGISWTTDLERAKFFSMRFESLHGNPQLWKTEVAKQDVAAFFTGRGENEIVFDPWSFDLELIEGSE